MGRNEGGRVPLGVGGRLGSQGDGGQLAACQSLNRIEAGGSYTKDNIQLVCRAVNSWRSNMPLKDFIDVCKAVASYQERLEGKDGPA